ncbi:hypothetical protein [Streptomyces smyrnaeus]|uniref:hypothetical protein n=1 Tax=Streptomyces smyrnaeus TaxID=1387713 RepID=UPI0033FE85DD
MSSRLWVALERRAEAERERDEANAALDRVHAVCDAIDTEMSTEPDTQRAAMQYEAVRRVRAALDEPGARPGTADRTI